MADRWRICKIRPSIRQDMQFRVEHRTRAGSWKIHSVHTSIDAASQELDRASWAAFDLRQAEYAQTVEVLKEIER